MNLRKGFTPPPVKPYFLERRWRAILGYFSPKSRALARGAGFTLIELTAVVIIIGILVAFALVQFSRTMSIAKAREMKSNLRLIQAAQKVYNSRYGSYVDYTDNIVVINTRLGLNLENSYCAYVTYNTPPAALGGAFYPNLTTIVFGYLIGEVGEATCLVAPCPD